MSDKQKYQSGEELVDQGWRGMRELLDEHMPQRKKKRKGILWWWVSIGTILALAILLPGWWGLPGDSAKETLEPSNVPQTPSPGQVHPPVTEDEGGLLVDSAGMVSSSKHSLLGLFDSTKTPISTSPEIVGPGKTFIGVDKLPVIAVSQISDGPFPPSLSEIENSTRSSLFILKSLPKLDFQVESRRSSLILPVEGIVTPSSIRGHWVIGAHGMATGQSILGGASIDFGRVIEWKGPWAVYGRLSGQWLQSSFDYQPISTPSLLLNLDDWQGGTAANLGNAPLESPELDIFLAGLEAGVGYRIAPRWKVQLGASVHFQMTDLFLGEENESNLNDDPSVRLENALPGGFNQTPATGDFEVFEEALSADAPEDILRQEGLRQTLWGLHAGLEYRLDARLSGSLIFYQGLTDITLDEFWGLSQSDRLQNLRLGLRYRF